MGLRLQALATLLGLMRVAAFVFLLLLLASYVVAVSEPSTATEESSDPVLLQVGVPILRDWIVLSRDEAVATGVEVIPSAVRSALAGYVPDGILDRVRWRVGGGGQLSVQQNSFYFADTPAVTLDYVIVFRDVEALENVELWVHELRHVIQFTEWGIEEFAARYLRDYEEIESDASRYRWQWVFRDGAPLSP